MAARADRDARAAGSPPRARGRPVDRLPHAARAARARGTGGVSAPRRIRRRLRRNRVGAREKRSGVPPGRAPRPRARARRAQALRRERSPRKRQLLEKFTAASRRATSRRCSRSSLQTRRGRRTAAARQPQRRARLSAPNASRGWSSGCGRSSGRTIARIEIATVNGETGLCIRDGDRLTATLSIATDGERILAVYAVVNPDKLQCMNIRSVTQPSRTSRLRCRNREETTT